MLGTIGIKVDNTNFTPPYDQSPYFAAVFDIVNGLVTTTNSVGNPTNTNSSIVDYGNGWFRISISAALSPSSGSFNFEFKIINFDLAVPIRGETGA